MSGRPDFTTPGSGGSGQRVSVSNRPEIKVIDATATGTVSAGESENISVFAPSGSVYKVVNVYMQAPGIGSATTGDHGLSIRGSNMANGQATVGRSSYGDEVRYQYSSWQSSTLGGFPQPETEPTTLLAVQSVRATENKEIRVKYTNFTDADQTGDRSVMLLVEEESY
jgi:hypothetical protein